MTPRSAVLALVTMAVLVSAGRGVARAQTPASATESPGESLVQVGDVLRIKVWPDSSLGGEYPVEETGKVYLPLIGEYNAGGRAVAEIRKELRNLYGRELKSPVVTVTPIFRVSVLGAVQRPGLYFADPTQTWFDVISSAGGFNEHASRESVSILRKGQTIRVNATTEQLQSGRPLNVAVQSGDRIIVPQASSFSWSLLLSVVQTAVIIATAVQTFR